MTGDTLYLLDTNITGYIVNGRSQTARSQLEQAVSRGRVIVSSITEAEILFGLERRPQAARLRAAVLALLGTVQILSWDSKAAQAHARLRVDLSAAGKTLSVLEMLIASHAVATGAVLVSHDQAFQHLAGFLQVVDWATDL